MMPYSKFSSPADNFSRFNATGVIFIYYQRAPSWDVHISNMKQERITSTLKTNHSIRLMKYKIHEALVDEV